MKLHSDPTATRVTGDRCYTKTTMMDMVATMRYLSKPTLVELVAFNRGQVFNSAFLMGNLL
jgi:hypothetical protein